MIHRRWWISGLALVGVAALLIGIGLWRGGDSGDSSPTVGDPPGAATGEAGVQVLAKNLEIPWGLAFLPDGSALVTERDSRRLLRLDADGTVEEVQRIDEASADGEGGLLGVEISPSYESDRWVYVYYSTEQDNRIGRLRLGEPPQPILTGIPRAVNHNGGRIRFGPDGMLYAGTGDAELRGTSQDRESLAGKILRMTPEGKPAPGNPFPGSVVYSLGHRNVQGLAWDSRGQLFAAEFGQSDFDELNRIEAGRNYGWPEVEGTGEDDRFVNPVATWAPSEASPSGLAIAGDRAYLACLRGQRLFRVGLDGKGAESLLTEEYGRLRDVVPAPDGSLWVLTSNRDDLGEPVADDDRVLRVRM